MNKELQGKAYLDSPKKVPIFIRIGTWYAERKAKKELLVPRLLAWYPKAALSSGLLEAMITHHDDAISDRLLQLIRIQVSILVNCPFCLDMNSNPTGENHISPEALLHLQQTIDLNLDKDDYFSEKEMCVLRYVRDMTQTPAVIDQVNYERLKSCSSERELIIMATTICQVNYWSRLMKGLGVPVACEL